MILPPALVRAIGRGAKTQSRHFVKDPREKQRKNGTTYTSQPFRPAVGHRISVQSAAGQLADLRVIVTDLRRELLGEITFDDARREGFKTTADFAHSWMRRHDRAWPPIEEQLCIRCDGWGHTNDDPCPDCDGIGAVDAEVIPPADDILERFQHRHGHHLVWVVTFELEADAPRFLHKDSSHGYTSNVAEALPDEPEVLAAPHPDWANHAEQHRRNALRDQRAARLSGLPNPEDRLAVIRLLAQEVGVDVDADLKVIRHRMNAMEQKVRDHAERRAA